MELQDYIKAVNKGDIDLVGEIDNQIESLQLKKYIIEVYNFIKTVEKIRNKNNVKGLCADVYLGCYGYNEYHFSSSVRNFAESFSSLNEEVDHNTLIKEVNEDLTKGLIAIFLKEKWLGRIKNENLTIDFDSKDCSRLEEWFFNKELIPMYYNAIFESELKQDKLSLDKKVKV